MAETLIDPGLWGRPSMMEALASRDIAAVYRLLQQHGVSQRRIAAMTEQSQSEICEILKGRRVVSYDVLVKIADGLSVPRGFMGLAHDDLVPAPDPVPRPVLDPDSRRWVVRVPVYVDTYGAAVGLCDAITGPVVAPPAARPKDPDRPDGRAVASSDAAPRRWHVIARSVLRSRERVMGGVVWG